jgi:ferric-dicitrate binding protein FerR (iron transport regulator)
MTKDLLIRFLNNNCTEAELNEVLHWVNTNALSDDGRQLGKNDWKNYQEESKWANDERFTILFDKIQEKIDSKENNPKQNLRLTIPLFTKWLTRAAAILLIPVLSFLFYTLSEIKTIQTNYTLAAVETLEIIAPIGSRTVVQLSDGSTVHLNYGSKLKYPQFFSGDTREIELVGEGFFEVAHNPEKPFIVKTGTLNVQALGTAFNVLAYADSETIETTLVNGKVVLKQKITNGKTKTIGTMEPGQHINYNIKTGAVCSTKGSVEKFVAWKDGKLVFEDATITDVAERLSRMFNVDIEVADDIRDNIYTVTFVDEPLFQILDLMTIATPVTYKTEARRKLPNGTFSKQKIRIEKRI